MTVCFEQALLTDGLQLANVVICTLKDVKIDKHIE